MDRPKATTQAPGCLQMDRSLETHAEPVFVFVFCRVKMSLHAMRKDDQDRAKLSTKSLLGAKIVLPKSLTFFPVRALLALHFLGRCEKCHHISQEELNKTDGLYPGRTPGWQPYLEPKWDCMCPPVYLFASCLETFPD